MIKEIEITLPKGASIKTFHCPVCGTRLSPENQDFCKHLVFSYDGSIRRIRDNFPSAYEISQECRAIEKEFDNFDMVDLLFSRLQSSTVVCFTIKDFGSDKSHHFKVVVDFCPKDAK